MKYYFDEAGDWEHPNAQHSIWPLMCGVLFTEKSYFNDIQRTFKVIRTERKILPSKFHAADASNSLKSSVFSVILDSLLSRKAKIIVRRVKPSLLRRTRLTPHDLYIEHASALIAKLAAGDAKPEIYSDMKFRGAYPMKIAEHAINPSFSTGNSVFDSIMQSYQIIPGEEDEKASALIKKFEKIRVGRFRNREDFKKLKEAVENKDSEVIRRCEFAELWINTKERDEIRERYRTSIVESIKNIRRSLELPVEPPSVTLRFVDKNENNPGIQFADFVCYAVQVFFDKSSATSTDLEKKICENCTIDTIEEVS